MRKIAFAAFALALSINPALAAASHNDSAVLSTNISAEAITGLAGTTPIAVHLKRANYCATVLAAPDSFKVLFALTAATDANVLADATQAGTVVLTSGNVAAQAALVTDAHIDAAVAGELPAYLAVP